MFFFFGRSYNQDLYIYKKKVYSTLPPLYGITLSILSLTIRCYEKFCFQEISYFFFVVSLERNLADLLKKIKAIRI